MNQIGFSSLLVILGIIIVIGVAGGAYYLGTQNIIKFQNPILVSQAPQPNPIQTPSPIPLISPAPIPTDSKISVTCPANKKQPILDVNEAAKIAMETNCSAEGTLVTSSAYCTTSEGNWTFGFNPKENKGNCGVTCYVNSETKIAELIWMCLGAKTSQ